VDPVGETFQKLCLLKAGCQRGGKGALFQGFPRRGPFASGNRQAVRRRTSYCWGENDECPLHLTSWGWAQDFSLERNPVSERNQPEWGTLDVLLRGRKEGENSKSIDGGWERKRGSPAPVVQRIRAAWGGSKIGFRGLAALISRLRL